jgi:hypothetical protein
MVGILGVLKLDKSKVSFKHDISDRSTFCEELSEVILCAVADWCNINLICIVFGTSSWLVRTSVAATLIVVATSLSTVP